MLIILWLPQWYMSCCHQFLASFCAPSFLYFWGAFLMKPLSKCLWICLQWTANFTLVIPSRNNSFFVAGFCFFASEFKWANSYNPVVLNVCRVFGASYATWTDSNSQYRVTPVASFSKGLSGNIHRAAGMLDIMFVSTSSSTVSAFLLAGRVAAQSLRMERRMETFVKTQYAEDDWAWIIKAR